jgi:hypothetical protein
MGISGGPNIIENGVIIALDASDKNSYAGSGTILKDLTGNNLSGSLFNGASFDTIYGGAINLDGVDDALNIKYFNLSSQSFAVDIWYQPGSNTENLRGIISCTDIWSDPKTPGWGIGFGLSSNNNINYGIVDSFGVVKINNYASATSTLNADKPYNITLVRNNNTETCNFYINGQLTNTNFLPASCSLSGNRTTISSAIWLYSPPVLGKIFSVKIYNEVNITSNDVIQNYNAQKSRFNL